MIQELEKALAVACMTSNILKSFELSGLHPLNPSMILEILFACAPKKEESSEPDQSKRSYIDINGKLLNSSEIIEQLKARDQLKKEKLERKLEREANRQKKKEVKETQAQKPSQSTKKRARPQNLCRITPSTRQRTTKASRSKAKTPKPKPIPSPPDTSPHPIQLIPSPQASGSLRGQCPSCGIVRTLIDGVCSNPRCKQPKRQRTKPKRFDESTPFFFSLYTIYNF